MNIIYLSRACSKKKYEVYSREKISQASQKYNYLLATGFEKLGAKVTMLSNRPINNNTDKRLLIPAEKESESGVDFYYLPVINLPIIRNFITFITVLIKVLFSHEKRKNTIVICDTLNISAALGVLLGSFFKQYKTVSIVTDVPCHFALDRKPAFHERLNLKIIKKFDSYLLLTESMCKIVNVKHKPYIVLEGHVDISMVNKANTFNGKYQKKVCIYAGSLKKIYGLQYLIDGFLLADIPDSELHIYGEGDYSEEIKKLSKDNASIKYFGIKPNCEVVDAEIKATLLINPRPTDEEYTQYSFPSKNMEYMVSGTPVLTTCLPGMPEDHKPYVFFIEEENSNGIAEALKRVFSHSTEELYMFGSKAKTFILDNKNNVSQAKKILDFVKYSFNLEENKSD